MKVWPEKTLVGTGRSREDVANVWNAEGGI